MVACNVLTSFTANRFTQGGICVEWALKYIQELTQYKFPMALLISFGAGLVSSFNPCMIGMGTSIIAFQKNPKKRIT